MAALDALNSTKLSTQLKGFIVPDIAANGAIYTLDDGIVTQNGAPVSVRVALPILRTAYFSVMNRLDPILALEGTDPERLATAVGKLKDSLRALPSDYDAETQEMLATSFYPLSFLATLPALEKKRQEVLARPTPQNTAAYGESLLESLSQYRLALAQSKQAFASLSDTPNGAAYTSYTFPGGTTSLETIPRSFASLDADAAAAQVKTEARLSCLTRGTRCEPLSTLLPKSEEIALISPLPSTLPTEYASIKSILSSFERERRIPQGGFRERGTVVLRESICVPSIAPMYAYLWETSDDGAFPSLRFQPLNDLYFYDLREETQSTFYNRIREGGIDFLGQEISNPYECPDSGLESARIASLYALARSAVDQPLFYGQATSDSAVRKIAEEEKNIAEGPLILESAVMQYSADLADLITEKGERVLAQEISPERVIEAERRITLAHAQSALFDEQIATAISMNAIVKGIGTVAGTPIPITMLYISRSYPSLLYLAGNKSIAPTPISFFEEKMSEPLSKFQLIPYSLLRKTYSDADVLRLMNASKRAYENIGKTRGG